MTPSNQFECSQMFLDVPRCSQMFPDVPRCSYVFLDVPICSWMFLYVPGCSYMFVDVPRYSQMFLDVPSCSQMILDVLRCSQMFLNMEQCYLHIRWYFLQGVVLKVGAKLSWNGIKCGEEKRNQIFKKREIFFYPESPCKCISPIILLQKFSSKTRFNQKFLKILGNMFS